MTDKDAKHAPAPETSGRPSGAEQGADMSGCTALAFNAAGMIIGGTAGFIAGDVVTAAPAAFIGYIGGEMINIIRASRAPRP